MTIVDFLNARLAEDLAVIDEAHKGDEKPEPGDYALYVYDDDYLHDTIVVSAPRVRQDVEMCKRLIAAHVGYYGPGDDEYWPIPTLSILASRYSTHPDYDPSWALDTAAAAST